MRGDTAMDTVREHLETFPFDAPPRVLRRRADLLHAEPVLPPGAPKRWRDHPPVEVVHFPAEYREQAFAPPRDVYRGAHLRVEWQTMNGRQPFYHRNLAVDEISYQVAGVRTLMSDLGSVDMEPGDLSRLPVGVVHDNYGRADIHLLFYVPAPMAEALPADRTSRVAIPPFEGWEAAPVNELVTDGLSGPGQDVAIWPADERALLEQAEQEAERLRVLRPADAPGTTWLYTSRHVLIGRTFAASGDGRLYRRVRNADEVHYQLSGTRTLVTQRGTVQLEPGDFVRVPAGVAFTSVHAEPSAHLTLASETPLERVAEPTRTAETRPAAETGGAR
ncbi:hypothetical protein ACQEU3_32370 [Spirillospora sp. CA-253888]